MNDIAKQRIVDKLFPAIKMEGLTQIEVAKMFQVNNAEISSMKNPKLWRHVTLKTWDISLQWVNSRQKLREYSEKHGKFMPERKVVEEHSPESVMPEEKNPDQAQKDHEAQGALKATEKILIPEVIKTPLGEEVEFRRSMLGRNSESQKVVIDIEINLIINGKKIAL